MTVAVTYEEGQVFQHFGHSAYFKIYQVEDGQIRQAEVCATEGHGHGALAGFLQEHGVNVLICGGIGQGARNALMGMGITLCPGVSGNADDAVAAWAGGNLVFDPDITCSHHESGHGHSCGEHSCGGHEHGYGEHSCGNH